MIPKSLAVLFAGAALAAGACGGGGGTESKGAPLCAVEPGPAPLRRITRFEYGRTVADLTGAPATVADQLPPDEETLGFDDIASAYSVSSLHAARYMGAAEEAAKVLTADSTRLTAFGGCNPTAGDDACVSAFIAGFGKRAWRRPLDADELQAMRAVYADTAEPGPADGVSAVIATMLQSPQFIYRPEPQTGATEPELLDGYALATRLSYLLTGAGPDDSLLAAAGAGSLDTEAGLLAETDRLLAGNRSTDLFVHVAMQWWEVGNLSVVDKDRSLYRTWNDATPAALAEETRRFLADAWQSQSGPTLAGLLTSPVSFMDANLATYYGVPAPSGSGFQRVTLDPARASGLLTQGSFLAQHAKADQTSPVLRGKFVRQQLFCTPPPPPPPDIVVQPPTVDPRLTTRQRFAQHTAAESCAACHSSWTPSASRSSTTTPRGAGVTPTAAASRSTRAAR